MTTSNLRWGAASEVGLVREINEDSKLHNPPVFAVADGMGGHSGGDVASKIAIDTLSANVLEDSQALAAAVRDANRAIYERASADSKLAGMGTTLTAIYAGEDSAQVVHVGDSRAYMLRAGELRRLTRDHTVVERLVSEGKISPEDADHHRQRNYLERALGIEPSVDIDVRAFDVEPGDRIMLCSDGLFGMIDEDKILAILRTEADPQKASKVLVREAVGAGGRDNVTTIVIDYPSTAGAGPTAAATMDPVSSPKHSAPGVASTPSGKGRRLVWFLATLLLIAAALIGAWRWVNSQWFLAEVNGKVAIFNGVPEKFLGLDLADHQATADLEASTLPDLYQRQLRNNELKASSLSEARSILRNLRNLGEPTPAPAPSTPVPSNPAPAAIGPSP